MACRDYHWVTYLRGTGKSLTFGLNAKQHNIQNKMYALPRPPLTFPGYFAVDASAATVLLHLDIRWAAPGVISSAWVGERVAPGGLNSAKEWDRAIEL